MSLHLTWLGQRTQVTCITVLAWWLLGDPGNKLAMTTMGPRPRHLLKLLDDEGSRTNQTPGPKVNGCLFGYFTLRRISCSAKSKKLLATETTSRRSKREFISSFVLSSLVLLFLRPFLLSPPLPPRSSSSSLVLVLLFLHDPPPPPHGAPIT